MSEHADAGPRDGSPDSFDRAVDLVAEHYPSVESLYEPVDDFRDRLARCLGDLLMARRGGAWDYTATKQSGGHPFDGSPYVFRNFAEGRLHYFPAAVMMELVLSCRPGQGGRSREVRPVTWRPCTYPPSARVWARLDLGPWRQDVVGSVSRQRHVGAGGRA